MPGTSSALAEITGGDRLTGPRTAETGGGGRTTGARAVDAVGGRPAAASGAMAAILEAAAARHSQVGPALRIRRHQSDEGPAFWRWDCARCGEYGGGRHHRDAISRALRHCAEHPAHRSSLLPPTRCRERDSVAAHPMLFAVDDDPPPAPLST